MKRFKKTPVKPFIYLLLLPLMISGLKQIIAIPLALPVSGVTSLIQWTKDSPDSHMQIPEELIPLVKKDAVAHRILSVERSEQTGNFMITNEKNTDFQILQLTDLHFGGSSSTFDEDQKALTAVYSLISHVQPDLIIITGDMVFANLMTGSVDNLKAMNILYTLMQNIGIPWVFTFGNHDAELFNSYDKEDLGTLLSSDAACLYQNTQSPGVSGTGNQTIEIKNADGSLNQALILIDSNSYMKQFFNNSYDYIHDDQVLWYENQIRDLEQREGHQVPSLLFFHIPLQEYQEAFDMYEQGSPEVTLHYGKKREGICASPHPSKMMEAVLRLKSTQGIFCGHDHLNDFSISYHGVRLTYGQSIDYLAYAGNEEDQRGATLITLHPDSSFDVTPIYYKDLPKL